jgi:hypothetical protein
VTWAALFARHTIAGADLRHRREDAVPVGTHLVDRHLRAPVPVVFGEFAGFKIEFRPSLPDTLTLQGVVHYSAKVSPSPSGIISSLKHAARSIEENLAARRSHGPPR